MPFGCGGRYFFGLMELETKSREKERRSRPLAWPLAIVFVALIFAGLIFAIFYRIETWPARTGAEGAARLEQLGREARDAFVRLAQLQPRVTINHRVYFEQTSTIAELSVLERRVEVEHEFLHTWAGSTKRLKLHGTFLVKAGFDLEKKFNVEVRPEEIVLNLPHAQILSVAQKNVEVLAFENGLWNRISAADLEQQLALLPQLAREKSSGLPAEAEQAFTRQLREKFHPEEPVRVIFPGPAPRG